MIAALWIISGCITAALVAFLAYVVGSRRAVQSFGQPTPAEAQITVDTANALKANADKAAAEAARVANASKAELLDIGREQLSDASADPSTTPTHSSR